MKRIVRVGEREAQVDWKNDGDRVTALLTWEGAEGKQSEFRYAEVEPGVYSLLAGDRAFEVRVTKGYEGWVVEIAGQRVTVEVEDPREVSPRRKGRGGTGPRSIQSPMPGKVVRVLVEEGATVEAGQGLVVVEAMKMQNEMKAPRSGRVVSLTARAGASVMAGEVLVTIE